mmetsp:Transcript_144434/g.462816  ORF Transcript_144434/g.462816 Transcript_144434/m.462816 type:complete len:356 (-) Transcript_144434:132-1199(-)
MHCSGDDVRRHRADDMRREGTATLSSTPSSGCGTEGVLGLTAVRRSAPFLGRRSRAQCSRAHMHARCFRRGAACALGPPGLGDLGLNSLHTIAFLDKCQHLDKSFRVNLGCDDHHDKHKHVKLDDGLHSLDDRPHIADDPNSTDEHWFRRNDDYEEHPSEDVEDHFNETGDAFGKYALPADDLGDCDYMPDCDYKPDYGHDLGTDGALFNPIVNSLYGDFNDSEEYEPQCSEDHDKYSVDDIEDRHDETADDCRCTSYAEGPLDILQYGNSVFSVAAALRLSVASRSCQRWSARLWDPPLTTWAVVLLRLEDSLDCFEELLRGDVADDGRLDQPPVKRYDMHQRQPFGGGLARDR